ncbi:hypothetical protein ACTXT7_005512 [Hymenolepis weldensis]
MFYFHRTQSSTFHPNTPRRLAMGTLVYTRDHRPNSTWAEDLPQLGNDETLEIQPNNQQNLLLERPKSSM